jgi:hypothetical protein
VIPGSPATEPLRHLLTDLAESGSTGAMHIGGTPGGTLYLVAGRITHAESPSCPGVGERLVSSGRLSAATWQAAYDAGLAERRVGQVLVRAGHLVQGELVCRVLATICDATHAILQSENAPVHFVAGERHWLGLVTQIELTALSRETARRRLLATPIAAATAAATVPADGCGANDGRPADGPRAGRPGTESNTRRPAPDYADLKRIRRALSPIG